MEARTKTCGQNERYFRHCLQQAVSKNRLSQDDVALWDKYITHLAVTSHISPSYRTLNASIAIMFRKFMKTSYAQLTDEIWIDGINEYLSSNYSVNTKNKGLDILKQFLLWGIAEKIISGLSEKSVTSIAALPAPIRTKTEADLITPEEVYQLLQSPQINPKLSAIIALLYWTGCRSGELLSLRWRDLHFNPPILEVIIPPYKTNPERYVVTAEALMYVAQWRQHYPKEIPGGPNGDNFVFVSLTDRKVYNQLSYVTLYKYITALSKRVLGRTLHPHQFRASHITNMASSGVSDMVNKMTHWGHVSTNMLSVYSIPSKDMIKTELLRASGIETEEKKNVIESVACPKCGTINRGNEYCGMCGTPLTPSAIHGQAVIDEAISRVNKMYDQQTILNLAAKQLGTSSDLLIAELVKVLTNLKSGTGQ